MNETSGSLDNRALDALALALSHQDLPPEKIISGRSQVGVADLGTWHDRQVGVWEITPGTSSDVEVDEVFVVLCGRATVRFADGSPDLTLRAGSVARLRHGQRTLWSVHETLRKVFLSSTFDAPAAKRQPIANQE